jgi:Zn-dependent metalloprotease
MKAFVLTLLAILLLAASARFIRALGDVKVQSLLQVDSDVGAARADATAALLRILQEGSAYAGDEVLVPTRQHARPDDGTHHIRFKQHVEGRPIEGASMVMHIRRENGTVYAVNGEFHPSTSIDPFEPNLDCETAMELARQEEHDLANGKWKWEGNCVDAVVQGRDGRAHFAYRRTLRYRQNDGSHSLDILFASPRDGLLLAVHPQLFRIRSLATIHCSELNESSCSLISTSPDKISIPYPAAQDAHNNVVDVYDFYEAQFGRLSIDGQEGAIGIVVGLNFSDSFFVAPNFLVFGNGNGRSTTSHCRNHNITLKTLISDI